MIPNGKLGIPRKSRKGCEEEIERPRSYLYSRATSLAIGGEVGKEGKKGKWGNLSKCGEKENGNPHEDEPSDLQVYRPITKTRSIKLKETTFKTIEMETRYIDIIPRQ